MANMGRPKSEVVKDKRIALRVTQEEHDKLKEYASKTNIKSLQYSNRSYDIFEDL